MLIGFTGASGRTDASHAALLAARAFAVDGHATLVVGQASRCFLPAGDATLSVVPVQGHRAEPCAVLNDARQASLERGHVTIVDVPAAWLARDAVRSALDVAIVVAGPHEADEREAASLFAGRPCRQARRGALYLGCRRAGGAPAAAAFAAAMAQLDPTSPSLPFVVPPLGRGEAAALYRQAAAGRALRLGRLLAASIVGFAAPSQPDRLTPPDTGAADVAGADLRSLPDRLRDLADDAEAVSNGFGPAGADLAGAPVLDGWAYDVVATPILKGRVTGHPNIPEGHRVRTSEVYLTDRATWARTLSRWYVLRAPCDVPAPGLQ